MAKRTLTEVETSAVNHGQAHNKVSTNASRRTENVDYDPEMGDFEDAWEDEVDEEEVEENENSEEGMDVDEIMPAIEDEDAAEAQPDVYIPGTHLLGKDEYLEPDDSVYEMRHSMKYTWPCLSFDILKDNLGDGRQRYPMTAYIVAGTQAEAAKDNTLTVFKMSSLHKTQNDGENSDDDSDDDDDDGDALDEDAVLEFRSVPHMGGVNRVRAQPIPLSSPLPTVIQPYHVASWAETGKVHLWDVRPLIESLHVPGYSIDKERTQKPIFTINSHGRAEGFAMDWASSGEVNPSALRLLTGDIQNKIFLTVSSPSGFNAIPQPFTSHTSSVEDLQWSPSQATVFASCSADQSVRIWDVRVKGRKSVVGITPAHDIDVNVISWNKATSYLLLSGGDEGMIKVWDLRNIKGDSTSPFPVASFAWHKAPITSIEWHPSEDSIFAASGADDQVTLWDLAVEQDDEEMGVSVSDNVNNNMRDVPAQLLFVHQGQVDVKEIHWHPQIPGAVITTASDGFNIFKTISV